jgi:hypothetical protein
MNIKQAFRASMNVADFMVRGYLADITPEELFTRSVPNANHIAWQLGHCILAERHLIESAVPGSMPELPATFAEKYGRGKAPDDDPAGYLSKEEFLQLAGEVRAATLRALDTLQEVDFDRPVSARVPPFVKTVGDCFATIGPHWSVHAGQWVVVRRKLGRPVLF